MDNNSLGGEIPAEIGNLTKLQFLNSLVRTIMPIPETIN